MKAYAMMAFVDGPNIFVLSEDEQDALNKQLMRNCDYPKILAIKWLRNHRGYTLRDAKMIVETFMDKNNPIVPVTKKGEADES